MSKYPFKLRMRRVGDKIVLEELAPSRSGSYFLRKSVNLEEKTLVEAALGIENVADLGLGSFEEIPLE